MAPEYERTLSEEALLHKEVEWAQAAMADAAQAMKRSLVEAADPKAWAQTHPWLTVGAAGAAGFVIAKALRPKSDAKIVADYLRKMQRELEAPPTAAEAAAAQPRSGGLFTSLMSIVQTAAMQLPAIYSQMKAAEAASHAAEASESTADAAQAHAETADGHV